MLNKDSNIRLQSAVNYCRDYAPTSHKNFMSITGNQVLLFYFVLARIPLSFPYVPLSRSILTANLSRQQNNLLVKQHLVQKWINTMNIIIRQ